MVGAIKFQTSRNTHFVFNNLQRQLKKWFYVITTASLAETVDLIELVNSNRIVFLFTTITQAKAMSRLICSRQDLQ